MSKKRMNAKQLILTIPGQAAKRDAIALALCHHCDVTWAPADEMSSRVVDTANLILEKLWNVEDTSEKS